MTDKEVGSRYANAPESVEGRVARPDTAANAAAFDRLQSIPVADRVLLIKNGTILSVDPQVGNLVGDILIRGSKIAQIGTELQADDAIVIDATGSIVAPGFVDSHLHAWEGQLRGTAPGIDFGSYANFVHGGLAGNYRPHDIYAGTLMTLLAALNAGITTVVDNSHNSRSPEHSNAAVEALIAAGIRGVHASGAPQGGDTTAVEWPQDILRLRNEYFTSDNQLVTLRLFDVVPDPEVWKFANNEGFWISSEMGAHVPNLRELYDAGLLTPEHSFSHCFGMSDEEWRLIADSGAKVNVVPRSDAVFGLGPSFAPIDTALAHGIRPGLSFDNEISYAADPFAEIQFLYTSQRSRTFERINGGDENAPALLELADVHEFSTIRSAENANVADRAGSLSPGKDADIILIDTTALNTFPGSNALGTLATFANPANVHAVFVAGEIRKWGNELVGQDVAHLKDLVMASRDHLFEAGGLRGDVFSSNGTAPISH